jgi:hypothetical protein
MPGWFPPPLKMGKLPLRNHREEIAGMGNLRAMGDGDHVLPIGARALGLQGGG